MTDRLDDLNGGNPASDLGIPCIWLKPIIQSVSYHGYDLTDSYAVEPDYSTRDEFLAFMDAAQMGGFHVIIDLVINHTSIAHPWFVDDASEAGAAHRDWYIIENQNPGYTGPWGNLAWHPAPAGADDFCYGLFWSGMPDLDLANPEVTAEIQAITRFWLTEMGVDGFRLDATRHLLALYRTWVQLRTAQPSLATGPYQEAEAESSHAMVFVRTSGNQTTLVLINLGMERTGVLTLVLPAGSPGARVTEDDTARSSLNLLQRRSLSNVAVNVSASRCSGHTMTDPLRGERRSRPCRTNPDCAGSQPGCRNRAAAAGRGQGSDRVGRAPIVVGN